LTPFPKLQFHPANDKSAKMLYQWLSENNLFPEIDEIKGKPGKWIVWIGLSAYCVAFKFDELVDGRKGGDVINSLSGDKEAKLRIIDRATKPSFKSGLTENIRKKLNNIPTKSINKMVKKL
jgi:hypothetical protein